MDYFAKGFQKEKMKIFEFHKKGTARSRWLLVMVECDSSLVNHKRPIHATINHCYDNRCVWGPLAVIKWVHMKI